MLGQYNQDQQMSDAQNLISSSLDIVPEPQSYRIVAFIVVESILLHIQFSFYSKLQFFKIVATHLQPSLYGPC